MSVQVAWRVGARQDLLDIYVRIGFDNPSAADRFYADMEARADMLARHPRLGPRRPDIRSAARVLVEDHTYCCTKRFLTLTMGRSKESISFASSTGGVT